MYYLFQVVKMNLEQMLNQSVDFERLREIIQDPRAGTMVERRLQSFEVETNEYLKKIFCERIGHNDWRSFRNIGALSTRHIETYLLKKELIDVRRPYLFMPNLSEQDIEKGVPKEWNPTAQITYQKGSTSRKLFIYTIGVSRLQKEPKLVYGTELVPEEGRVSKTFQRPIKSILDYMNVNVIKNSSYNV